MAMSARVTNANGRIVAEKRNGQRSYHQHDALGNTIALINDAGTVTNTFDYWPYGELRTPVFGLPTPFLYCGQWGYYTDTTGRIYVRARTYRPVFTRWLTVDPLWPWEMAYVYGDFGPLTFVDPTGAACCAVPTTVYFKGSFFCMNGQHRTYEKEIEFSESAPPVANVSSHCGYSKAVPCRHGLEGFIDILHRGRSSSSAGGALVFSHSFSSKQRGCLEKGAMPGTLGTALLKELLKKRLGSNLFIGPQLPPLWPWWPFK